MSITLCYTIYRVRERDTPRQTPTEPHDLNCKRARKINLKNFFKTLDYNTKI